MVPGGRNLILFRPMVLSSYTISLFDADVMFSTSVS